MRARVDLRLYAGSLALRGGRNRLADRYGAPLGAEEAYPEGGLTLDYIISGIAALLLFGYLIYALLRPERF
jgi:K+-transporting ATPase KdpF subunit